MINGIDLLRLRNVEFLQFVGEFSKFVDSNDPVALDVAVQQAAFKVKIEEVLPLFKQARSSSLTPELHLLDQRRNKAYKGITFTIKGCSYHFNAETVKCAKRLIAHLRIFGKNITRQNIPTKSYTINAIITDWETDPELTTSLATLDLVAWVMELKTANQLFDEKFMERTEEYGAANPETMKGKRAETVAAYYELRKFLDANEVLRHDSVYEKTINELNALIEIYNQLIAKRKKPIRKKPEITDK